MITKLGTYILGCAVLATGGLTFFSTLTPTTIGEELEASGIKLLNSTDNRWNKLAKKHKNSSNNNPKKISSLEENGSQNNEDKESLIKKCKTLWQTPLKDAGDKKSQKIEDIKNWCTTDSKALTSIKNK